MWWITPCAVCEAIEARRRGPAGEYVRTAAARIVMAPKLQ